MIHCAIGDATQPPLTSGVRVICHVCNNRGAWGAGFVLAVSRRWPEPERRYLENFARTPQPKLGDVEIVRVEAGLYVANMIAQDGFACRERPCALDYWALSDCFRYLDQYAERDWSFHMPRIGCGLAGGEWSEVEAVIDRTLAAYPVTVYDLPAPARPRRARLK